MRKRKNKTNTHRQKVLKVPDAAVSIVTVDASVEGMGKC